MRYYRDGVFHPAQVPRLNEVQSLRRDLDLTVPGTRATCIAELPLAVGMPRSFRPAARARSDVAPIERSSAMMGARSAVFAGAIAVLAALPARRASCVSLAPARKPPSFFPRLLVASSSFGYILRIPDRAFASVGQPTTYVSRRDMIPSTPRVCTSATKPSSTNLGRVRFEAGCVVRVSSNSICGCYPGHLPLGTKDGKPGDCDAGNNNV